MGKLFKIGDKTFKSSGNPDDDLNIIKENFPDYVEPYQNYLSTTAQQKPFPDYLNNDTQNATKNPNVLSKIDLGPIKMENLDTVKAKEDIKNQANLEGKQDTALIDKTDIKGIIDKIRAIDEANMMLEDARNKKNQTPTGPFYSDFFDASIHPIKDGVTQPPSFFDSLIEKFIPERTNKISDLNQSLSRVGDYMFTKGGKALSEQEINQVRPQFPDLYQSDDDFNKKLESTSNFLNETKKKQIEFLKNIGVDASSLGDKHNDLVNSIEEELKKRQAQ